MSLSQYATYYSHGKLLLSGEYLVLKGATAFALPTKFGQDLEITSQEEEHFLWRSFDHLNRIWLEVRFEPASLDILAFKHDQGSAIRLQKLLRMAFELSDQASSELKGVLARTGLEFDRSWGLGTSSTLINNLADWLRIDPYILLKNSFGGSGYDIACARYDSPLLFSLKNAVPDVTEVNFNPAFANQLSFVYLNQKQVSRESIQQFEKKSQFSEVQINRISEISREMYRASDLKEFSEIIREHEDILSDILRMDPIKKRQFHDFKGEIKSLGAWGGDFVLVASSEDPADYFRKKGYHTIVPFQKMIG